MPPLLVAVVGPTATGKSAFGLALAGACAGEIISCDSTAVYRGLDIGTDKLSVEERRGIPHHLIDIVDPLESYSAARFAADAAAAARAIVGRGRLPILVGGTGFYARALVHGIFPGPSRDDRLRARLDAIARGRGVLSLHRWVGRVDPESAARIQPRDQKRLVRALEVYLLTGRPLSDHFVGTASAIPEFDVLTIGLDMPRTELLPRVSRRVDEQFTRGVVEEVERLMAAGVPASSQVFSGLVYRQVIDLLHGVRGLDETRELVVRENMRYARRQLTWFRRDPGVHWLEGPGEAAGVQAEGLAIVREQIAVSAKR